MEITGVPTELTGSTASGSGALMRWKSMEAEVIRVASSPSE